MFIMKIKPLVPLIIFIAVVLLPGCAPVSPFEPTAAATPAIESTPTAQTAAITTPKPTPSIVPTQDLVSAEGPLLLIQTGFYEYLYIDPKNQTSFPFKAPISNPQFRLGAHLSPSGRLLFIPQDDTTGLIINLITGEVVHTYQFSSLPLFQPELAASQAQPLVTVLNLSEAALLEAVVQAYQRSKGIFRWYHSDRYHISVQDSGETSTSLFLDDHQTGTRLQLEDQPGLVNDYRVGPDGKQILLQKGLVFMPGAYRDKQYYLINLEDQTTQHVPLPEDVQNPSVTWFAVDTLSAIHHAFMSGGSGFSRIDTKTMQASQVIAGEFSDLRRFGEHLFVIRRESDPEGTTFELLTLEGETVAAQTFDKSCFYQYAVSDRIIFQCELESFVLDKNFSIEPFGDLILTITPAPDGRNMVMINRSEQSFILDADLQVQSELPLEETPLEIRWHPDSNGFLYRTHGRLFFYNLTTESSHLLIESDLFSDYTNINAVWVNLD